MLIEIMRYQNKSTIFGNRSSSLQLLLKIFLFCSLSLCSVILFLNQGDLTPEKVSEDTHSKLTSLEKLNNAFEKQISHFQVNQTGRITKILRDDNHRPRHQRFVLQLDSNQKLLIAHNIDLAPKIENLKEGTSVSFYGEYEWNNKGGIVHWTHHDPKGLHPDGWLIYGDRKYE
jgi:hypothetical protein